MATTQAGLQPILPYKLLDNSQLVYVKTNIAGYFFDAVIDSQHTHQAKITSHPVQSGANITDHIYIEPVELTMTIKMSDAMRSLKPEQFSESYSRSISAYNVLRSLQKERIPFPVTTRLERYENMVIETISVSDDYKTLYGLDVRVTMKQIIVVEVRTIKVTNRVNVTDSVGLGVVNAQKFNVSNFVIQDPDR